MWKWVWGPTGEDVTTNDFNKSEKMNLGAWKCAIMDPVMEFKWEAAPCIDKHQFVCETNLLLSSNNNNQSSDLQPAAYVFPRKIRHSKHKKQQRWV
jgi:hypothetical protein